MLKVFGIVMALATPTLTTAQVEAPLLMETWQQTKYGVYVEDEGADPYIEFATEGDVFFGYANAADQNCRGGTFEDLRAVWESDPDDQARIRFVSGHEINCPGGTYICIDPEQDATEEEVATVGFCGSIRLERLANE